jgi:hypothetical protein
MTSVPLSKRTLQDVVNRIGLIEQRIAELDVQIAARIHQQQPSHLLEVALSVAKESRRALLTHQEMLMRDRAKGGWREG